MKNGFTKHQIELVQNVDNIMNELHVDFEMACKLTAVKCDSTKDYVSDTFKSYFA